MSDLSIELHWHRAEPGFQPGGYSAEHVVRYNNSYEVQADAAPEWGGKAENTNPEQALASALSSCHMITFLALAAKAIDPATLDSELVLNNKYDKKA